MKNKIALFVFSLGVVLAPSPAAAQFGGVVVCPLCASQITSAAQYAQQVATYAQQAQQLLNTINMLQNMVNEAKQLATHPSTNIQQDLAMLQTVTQQAGGIAGTMAQMNQMFQKTFAPFSPGAGTNYGTTYTTWAQTALKTLNGALNASGYQGQMLQSSGNWTSAIQTMNGSSQGRDASIQLTNSIAAQQTAELQSLRQLIGADIQAKTAFMASQINQQQAAQTAQQNGLGSFQFTADQRGW
jgi:P-type conjugative transfer protein TrbJ